MQSVFPGPAQDDTVVEEAETITVEASHDSKVIGSVDVEITANDATTFTGSATEGACERLHDDHRRS